MGRCSPPIVRRCKFSSVVQLDLGETKIAVRSERRTRTGTAGLGAIYMIDISFHYSYPDEYSFAVGNGVNPVVHL